MKVADYIADILIKNDVTKVFGYIGGNNAHIFDAIDRKANIEMVNAVHEQGAGFAAEGYARSTTKLGVATATSGPGATNLVTPIGSCFMDSVPTLFLTGQVNRYEYKYDEPVRQMGFQEMDIVSITKPITKYSVFIDKVEALRYELEKACYLAMEGRKGPVLVDIPIDLQYQDFNPKEMNSFYDSAEFSSLQADQLSISSKDITEVQQLLEESERPLLLLGGGARLSNVKEELLLFLKTTNIPVVVSLMGKDMIDSSYPYNLGFIGAYGIDNANLILKDADLIIILGARLDARQTTRDVKGFTGDAKVIHVDIDKHELNRRIIADKVIVGDVHEFISKLNQKKLTLDIEKWKKITLAHKSKHQLIKETPIHHNFMNKIIHVISNYLRDDDIICVDVGLHQMAAAQSLELKGEQRILFSGGAGAMGFALPVAIGATLGTGKRAIVITGDGGFQMNLQELEVIKRRNLPIKIFIMNNHVLGMVKNMQSLYLGKNYIGTENDYSAPNFRNLARTYQIKGYEASGYDFIKDTVQLSLRDNQCTLVNIQLDEKKAETTLLEGYSDTSDREKVNYSQLNKKDTMVILAFGQANAANGAAGNYHPKNKKNIYNVLDNACYFAKDPLLGATATTPKYQGSVWLRVADKLIENGNCKNVIIKSIAVAGTPISSWAPNGKGTGWGGVMHGSYYYRIIEAYKELQSMGFNISHILVHQGESDAQNQTTKEKYKKSFLHIMESMKREGIETPVYLSLASRYGYQTSDNIISAQKELIRDNQNILEGPNTDTLNSFEDRLENGGANMTELGVEKHANLWFEILKGS